MGEQRAPMVTFPRCEQILIIPAGLQAHLTPKSAGQEAGVAFTPVPNSTHYPQLWCHLPSIFPGRAWEVKPSSLPVS